MRRSILAAVLLCGVPAIAAANETAAAPPLSAAARQEIAQQTQKLLGQPGVTRVGFYELIVNRQGDIVAVAVARSSGNPGLDNKVLSELRLGHVRQLPANSPPTVAFILPVEFKKNGSFATPLATRPAQ